MDNFNNVIDNFFKQDKYLTEDNFDKFLKENNIINYLDKSQRTKLIREHNINFLNNTLKNKQEYFDNMFKDVDPNIKLDKEQIKAIIADENLLIIAGAGAGKTTTMAAKVKYLVDSGYREDSILVVSFTNKACEEIRNIIHKNLGCTNVKVTTFHSLGYDIIRKSGRNVTKIIEEYDKEKILMKFIKEVAFNNKNYLYALLNTFHSFLNFDERALQYESFTDFHNRSYLEKYENSNLSLNMYINEIINRRRNNRKTIKGEKLRSKEEVDIANFLYLNNIDYEYEKTLKISKDNKYMHPDFFIKQLELKNYIEHFGLDKNLDNKMYNELELKNYLNTLKLKQKYMNQEDNSKLFIVTYSSYKDKDVSYLSSLEEQLINKGYTLTKRNDDEVFDMLKDTDANIYFYNFVYDVVIPFISVFKTCNFHLDDFKKLYEKASFELKSQLIVLRPIYMYYQKELERKHYIDFDDMINLAYEIIPTINEKILGVDYQYLIIDEYQDISNQKYNLTKLFADLFEAKVMAVGDDWQTIYSFSGSDITLFHNFEEQIENAKLIPIKNTYRNSQELINIAGEFIQHNKYLIRKELKSSKHLVNPIEIYYYEDYKQKNDKVSNIYMINNNQAKAVTMIISEIVKNKPDSKILLLGRYNKDKNSLLSTNYFKESRGKIKSEVIEDADLTFLTVHKSKGLGADAVILINAVDSILGFPSKIEDLPIISLLKDFYKPIVINNKKNKTLFQNTNLKEMSNNEYSKKQSVIQDVLLKNMYLEERRLFYVAMTRTKSKFYVTVPKTMRSMFIREIREYSNVIEYPNIIRSTYPIPTNWICPICNHPLNMLNYKGSNFIIYKCSNKTCDFKTTFPKKLEPLTNCPLCGEIVIFSYNNSNKESIYHCFNKDCDYRLIK